MKNHDTKSDIEIERRTYRYFYRIIENSDNENPYIKYLDIKGRR